MDSERDSEDMRKNGEAGENTAILKLGEVPYRNLPTPCSHDQPITPSIAPMINMNRNVRHWS